MEKSKFINMTKSYAINTMKKYNILASLQIAQVILETSWGESDLFKKANNVGGIKGTYNGEYYEIASDEYENGKKKSVVSKFKKYPSLEEGFEDRIKNILNCKKDKTNYRYRNLIGVTDYKKAAKLIQQDGWATDPAYAEKLIAIIESNKLYELDELKEIKETNKTIVEVDKVSNENLYRVRKTITSADSQLGAFRNKEAAIEICDKHIGYHVYDLRGNLIHTSIKKDPSEPSITSKVMIKGALIKLNNAPLYISTITNQATKKISGVFYVYDGKKYVGNRYRICKNKNDAGKGTKYIMGYIDLDDIQ